LAEGDSQKAVEELLPVRRLGGDFHQHHFIDTYIALALFRLGDYPGASSRWYQGMQTALAVGHIRGVAGAIEGCAYIAERLGKVEESGRFLSAAAEIRKRMGSPLYSFWYQHHDAAIAASKSALGEAQYAAIARAGAEAREEDIVNEVATMLRDFAAANLLSD
jgi:hypothetical protein